MRHPGKWTTQIIHGWNDYVKRIPYGIERFDEELVVNCCDDQEHVWQLFALFIDRCTFFNNSYKLKNYMQEIPALFPSLASFAFAATRAATHGGPHIS